MCDNGSEFISKNFVDICKQKNINIDYVNINNHLISHVGNRLGIVDRWIQTFRSKNGEIYDRTWYKYIY